MHSNQHFLENYQEELQLIHQLMAEFTQKHPQAAARLRLNQHGTSDDDAIGHLLETLALSAAKTRFHLEDECSEISDYLLENLHPHAISPIPSLALVQFKFNRQTLTRANLIPAGSTLLTKPVQDQHCIFKTCYPVNVLPLACIEATLMEKPLQAPAVPALIHAKSVLRLQMVCTIPTLTLADLPITSLRFFIHAKVHLAHSLYELLFNHTLAIALANSTIDTTPLLLDAACLNTVGFTPQEEILPYGQHTPQGYRLLTDFFVLGEKFLFFEINGLEEPIQQKFNSSSEKMEIYFYLSKSNTALAKKITADYFALHCTPIVNLFEHTCEPFSLDKEKPQYLLQPRARSSVANSEIYSIEQVTATLDEQKTIELLAFHKLNYQKNVNYYHIDRKPAWYFGHYPLSGSEVTLHFTDLNNKPLTLDDWKIFVHVLCTNRNLPIQLVLEKEQQQLTLERKIDGIEGANCIIPFTHTHHPFLNPKYKWQYIAHISLDLLWCASLKEGVLFFQSLLDLYEFNSEKHRNLREGILNIDCKNAHQIRQGGHGTCALWHGIKVTLIVDPVKFEKIGLYLFACVLDRFLPIFAATNLYTQLVVKNQHEILYKFAPRPGEKWAI